MLENSQIKRNKKGDKKGNSKQEQKRGQKSNKKVRLIKNGKQNKSK